MQFPPVYVGTVVRRITIDPGGLALWIRTTPSARERCYPLEAARLLLERLPEGLARHELTDALRLCDSVHLPPRAVMSQDGDATPTPA